jgi:hypothetical protein
MLVNKQSATFKVLNMKLKRKCPRGRLGSRCKQEPRKDVIQEEERTCEECEEMKEEELWEDKR